ncbi:hypothetical protein ACERK3_02355 [Phycisphaerales bacterium AB-hyl4]|uniref:Uncharacterized protein n=1 Tax=Natronomicrosphaera hydrolytica TaxID=3242702 RepID=A0ABV4U493_9BACT
MMTFLYIVLASVVAMLAGAGVLHLLPRLGGVGRRVSAAFCRAPALDIAITYFLIGPPLGGAIVAGWLGLLAAVVGQIVGLQTWVFLHELANPAARKGPRIVKTLNRIVGRWRNHTAVWITGIAVPLFWIVRVTQIIVYPPITWLVGLPRYRTGDWVNVSRHKFQGLVGHDLIWCLYCDWMTGVWSLGSEMLRNVESFWCPIRFDSSKKCENCKIDFPDVEGTPHSPAWVPADGNMQDVTELLEKQYTGKTNNAWFAHPARLTVKGEPVSERPAP